MPVRSKPIVPGPSTRVAEATSTGPPDSVPPDWVNLAPSPETMREPPTIRVPADWVNVLPSVNRTEAPWAMSNVPELTVGVPLSNDVPALESVGGGPRTAKSTVPPA